MDGITFAELELDHDYTKEIVCPWCGCVHDDSWQYQDDTGTIECWECKKEFLYDRFVEVTYCTERVVEHA